jgi:signal peptidase I
MAFVLAFAAFAAGLVGMLWGVRNFKDTESVMEPTLRRGDALITVPASGLRRGDIVLARAVVRHGRTQWSARGGLEVLRVIGLPGDHVSCCNAAGQLVVDGKALDETYLPARTVPSLTRFSVTLGPGRYWLMGDRRRIALDSRQRGPAPLSDIPRRVVAYVSNGSFHILRTPEAFVANGLEPRDTRFALAPVWSIVCGAGIVLLLGVSIFGIARGLVRRHRNKRSQVAVLQPQ